MNVSTKMFIRFRKVLTRLYWYKSFLSTQLLNELSYPFYLTFPFITFFIDYFFYSKFLLIYFLQFFFIKRIAITSSSLRLLITYVHGTVFLIYLITKTSSDQFGVWPLARMLLYFDILI